MFETNPIYQHGNTHRNMAQAYRYTLLPSPKIPFPIIFPFLIKVLKINKQTNPINKMQKVDFLVPTSSTSFTS